MVALDVLMMLDVGIMVVRLVVGAKVDLAEVDIVL